MKPDHYTINEIFYSLQGEGWYTGTPNIFVRFSGCNLRCTQEQDGFDCDTEFVSGVAMTAQEIAGRIQSLQPSHAVPLVLTGGEPALQLDRRLLDVLQEAGWNVAIETNGTIALENLGLDWISCSPKSAEHTLKLREAHELRYVRNVGQGIPKPVIQADHKFISPAFEASGTVNPKTMEWCVNLVKENPGWRLSTQLHKIWNIR
jgi:organic radical activating enzyme